ncbi:MULTISPECIES: AMP-binding protein [Cyanophyceae]|uniref:AMP-binding protein n=1 Tax=Leptolyngbya subtilissima DQ-A4 TaxID=2933933 RepID=A0ABV0K4P1_9CYAN|nr:AMP-binding protein [Nodosilinea sp. FACHB-141]MBD2111680.1 AMP-binding protein [Nodosilinea sp. FACHB-141]
MLKRTLNQTSLQPLTTIATFVELLALRAEQTPQGTAYRFLAEGTPETAETITYSALQQRAQAIAVLLQDLNCLNQPVLLLYPAGLDYIAAFFGCLYAGAIAVPAYPPRPNRSLDRIQAMVQDAGATVALTDSATLQKLERRLAETPQLRSLYCLSTDGLQADLAQQWRPPTIQADTLALLQYTSGSTALPKGVMISHDNLLHNSELIGRCFGNTAASRGVSWLPPYHDMGLVGGILQPLYVGAEMTLMAPVSFLQRPVRWLEAISHYQATTSGGPNFAYDLCVRKTTPEQRRALDLSPWQLAFSGAEPVHQATLAQFAAAFVPSGFRPQAFYPCYGMAETTLLVTGEAVQGEPKHLILKAADLQQNQVTLVSAADADAARPIVSCGPPAIPNQVTIVDPDSHRPCPPNTIGEIWVRWSRSIAQGYWRREVATQEAFQATLADGSEGPFLRTGDLGFLHGDDLYVTGRLKDLIIIRGRNHYPQDIEATAEQAHRALRQGSGAAFSVMEHDTEHLVIVHELERSALRTADPEAIFAALRRRVAEDHELQVGAIALLKPNALPKTSSGKVQRHLCRSMFLAGQFDVVYGWPTAETSQALAIAEAPVDGDDEAIAAENSNQPEVDAKALAVASPASPAASPLNSPDAIADWMLSWLANALNVPKHTLNVRQPLAEHGLDSLAAVELAEALESTLGVSLSPTLAYEYPTIEALSIYLATAQDRATVATPLVEAVDHRELEQIVRELELLSDAEVQTLLGRQSH